MDRLRYQTNVESRQLNQSPAVEFLGKSVLAMDHGRLKIGTVCHSLRLFCAIRRCSRDARSRALTTSSAMWKMRAALWLMKTDKRSPTTLTEPDQRETSECRRIIHADYSGRTRKEGGKELTAGTSSGGRKYARYCRKI